MAKKKKQASKQQESNRERDAQGHFLKGQSGNPEGRPVGAQNKVTSYIMEGMGGTLSDLHEIFKPALIKQYPKIELKGHAYFTFLGVKYPKEFMRELGKLFPKQVTLSGDPDNPLIPAPKDFSFQDMVRIFGREPSASK